MKPITRKRALERALQSMQREELAMRKANQLVQDSLYRDTEYKAKKLAEYAELTAAIVIIEGMTRQQEMHL